jgi:hypothetical protein
MHQTKWQSFIETCTQTAIGWFVSLLTWYAVLWSNIFDVNMSFSENVALTTIFTVVSVARGYIIRRFYDRRQSFKNA